MSKEIGNQQNNNQKIKNLLKLIINADKEKIIITLTLELIKKHLTQPITYNFDTIPLFNKLDQLKDKSLYIKTGIALIKIMPHYISMIFFKKIINYIIISPHIEPFTKIDNFLSLSNSFNQLVFIDLIDLVQFLYFDCLLKEEYINPEVIMLCLVIFNNTNPPKKIIELIIDTCIIIALKMKDDQQKQSYYSIIFNVFEYYLTKIAIPKMSVLKNMIHFLLYDYSDLYRKKGAKGKRNHKELWKYIDICFKCHHSKTFRIILDCINIEMIKSTHYTFTTVQVFNDEFDIDISDKMRKYNEFITINSSIIDSFIKEPLFIIRGGILAIGATLYHSRLNRCINENSQLVILSRITKLFTSLPMGSAINISYEIMATLQFLLNKFLNNKDAILKDEWLYIFPLIQCLFTNEAHWSKDKESKEIIKDIIHSIIILVSNDKLFQHPLLYNHFLLHLNMILINSDAHMLMKIRIMLLNNKQFQTNYCQIFFGFFFTRAKPHLQVNVMEMIRYTYTFNDSLIKTKMIETHLYDFFDEYIISLKKNEIMYAYFTYFINEILIRSSNDWIVIKIIKKMILYENDIQNSNDEIMKRIYNNFLINTLKDLFSRLQCSYQLDKMKLYMKIFFSSNAIKSLKEGKKDINKINFPHLAMVFLEEITINEYNEVSFSIKYLFKHIQHVIINYQAIEMNKIKEQLTLDNYKKLKADYYAPFTIINHHHLFNYLLAKSHISNKDVLILLKFIFCCLKKMYCLRGICIDEIIEELIKDSSIVRYTSTKLNFNFMMGIITHIAYHLDTELFNGHNNNTNQLSIKSLSLKTALINTINNTIDLFIGGIDKSLSILKDTKLMIESGFDDQKIPQSDISNTNLIIYNNHLQLLKESKDYILPTFKYSFNIIKKLFKILQFLLMSLIPSSFYLPSEQIPPKSSQSKYQPKIQPQPNPKEIQGIITYLIDDLLLKIWITNYQPSCSIIFLQFFLGIKELVCSNGDDLIHKVILMTVILGYPQYGESIDIAYKKYFNKTIHWRKVSKDNMNKLQKDSKWKESNMKLYIKQLSHIVIIYYLTYICGIESMWEVINDVFFLNKKDNQQLTILRNVFYWALYQRGDRDTIKIDYYKNIPKLAIVFITDNQKDIITINPINHYQTDITIRNMISNISITINNNNDDHIMKNIKENNIVKLLIKSRTKCNERKGTIETIDKSMAQELQIDDIQLTNTSILIEKITYLTNITFNHLKPIPHNLTLINKISQLDNTFIYKSYHCGILYFPFDSLSFDDALSYSSQVSDAYIQFITSLGQIIYLPSNPKLFNASKMKADGTEGSYIIHHKDILYQLIFHISNIIIPQLLNEPINASSIISLRTKILSTDNIIIVWMENPQMEFNPKEYFNQYCTIFIIIQPISTTHYLITRKYNNKAINIDLHKMIHKYFIDEYVINISTICGIEYLIQNIIAINRMTEYILLGNKESLLDNLSSRYEAFNQFFKGI